MPTGADREKIDAIIAKVKPCKRGRNCTFKNCQFRHPTASAVRKMKKRAVGRTQSNRYLTPGKTRWRSSGSRLTQRGTEHNRYGSVRNPSGSRRSRGGRAYTPRGSRRKGQSTSPGGRRLRSPWRCCPCFLGGVELGFPLGFGRGLGHGGCGRRRRCRGEAFPNEAPQPRRLVLPCRPCE